MEMSKTTKRSVAVFLLALVVCVLAWRLWPDGGEARRQQRNRDLLRAVSYNRLAEATHLLDEGADPNAQVPPLSFTQKTKLEYLEMSRGKKPVAWSQIDAKYADTGWSVLEVAVIHNKVSMVQALLSKGADAGYHDPWGQTALGWANMLKGGSPLASGTADSLRIAASLQAAEAKKKAL